MVFEIGRLKRGTQDIECTAVHRNQRTNVELYDLSELSHQEESNIRRENRIENDEKMRR